MVLRVAPPPRPRRTARNVGRSTTIPCAPRKWQQQQQQQQRSTCCCARAVMCPQAVRSSAAAVAAAAWQQQQQQQQQRSRSSSSGASSSSSSSSAAAAAEASRRRRWVMAALASRVRAIGVRPARRDRCQARCPPRSPWDRPPRSSSSASSPHTCTSPSRTSPLHTKSAQARQVRAAIVPRRQGLQYLGPMLHALLGALFVPLAKRNPPSPASAPLERTVAWHARSRQAAAAATALHGGGFVCKGAAGDAVGEGGSERGKSLGAVAALVSGCTYFLSRDVAAQRYNLFRASHLALAPLYLYAVLRHYRAGDLLAVLVLPGALLAVDLYHRLRQLLSDRATVVSARRIGAAFAALEVRCGAHSAAPAFRPGQWAYVAIPSLSSCEAPCRSRCSRRNAGERVRGARAPRQGGRWSDRLVSSSGRRPPGVGRLIDGRTAAFRRRCRCQRTRACCSSRRHRMHADVRSRRPRRRGGGRREERGSWVHRGVSSGARERSLSTTRSVGE